MGIPKDHDIIALARCAGKMVAAPSEFLHR